MALARSGGERHRIRYDGHGCYVLSWSVEYKVGGSRLLFRRTMTRDTDRAGAERFARKWRCAMPAGDR